MSGAIKGYRFVATINRQVVSRHHAKDAALSFQRANAHRDDIIVYQLAPMVPIAVGEVIPESAVEVTEPTTRFRRKPTYR